MMKYAVLLVVGLLAGALGATMVVNAMRARDAYARGVMDVMQQHYGSLREDIRARRCDATRSALALARIRAVRPDIESAIYPDSMPEASFREFAQRLDEALLAVPSPPPADCAALAPLVQAIGKACDDCHQQYR